MLLSAFSQWPSMLLSLAVAINAAFSLSGGNFELWGVWDTQHFKVHTREAVNYIM